MHSSLPKIVSDPTSAHSLLRASDEMQEEGDSSRQTVTVAAKENQQSAVVQRACGTSNLKSWKARSRSQLDGNIG
jgi:hypothetical protein